MELKEIKRRLVKAEADVAYWKLQLFKAEKEIEKHLASKKGEVKLIDIKRLIDVLHDCDISSRSRERVPYVYGRNVYCHIARKYTTASYDAIGNIINRNHATVINSVKTFENDYNNDYEFIKFADEILKQLPKIKTQKNE